MLAIGKVLTAEQRLIKAISNILAHKDWVAISGVLAVGKREICDKTKTAATNGRDEKYGRAFVDSLTDPELRFLILHEAYHKMYRHLTTWKSLHDINHKLANAATDYVINIQLVDADPTGAFVKMPECGLIDPKYRGMSAAEVFKLLQQEQSDDSSNEDTGAGDDDGFDEHDWDGAADMGEQEAQELTREIEAAVRQGLLAASRQGSGGLREMQELVAPKVDWRAVLNDFLKALMVGKEFSTWSKPNRRYLSQGMYMPSGVSHKVGDIVIAIDTSGSIDNETLRVFLSEVAGICDMVKPSKVHLVYWDTRIARHEVYADDKVNGLAHSTKPAGGGGTDPNCVTRFLREKNIKPEAVVMFTDGIVSSWGMWSVPVLWCITTKGKTAPVGKSVYVEV